MRNHLIIVLCLYLSLYSYNLQAENFVLIHGENHLYSLLIPDGWMTNRTLAQRLGIPAPFFSHPRNESNIKTFIYSYGYENRDQTIKKFIKISQNRLQNALPKIHIDRKGDVKTKYGSRAILYHYNNFRDNHVEDVAFTQAKNIICVIVLSTREKENYEKQYSEFLKTVKSFYYISESPQSFGK